MDGSRLERLTPVVRHADGCGVQLEEVDHRLRNRIQRRLDGEALGEGMRDLVQPAELARGPALGIERAFQALAELLCTLVQPRVLHGDRELARKGKQQTLLPFAEGPRPGLEDPERPDHLVVDDERDEEDAPHATLLPAALEAAQARIAAHILDEDVAAASEGPQGELEQSFRKLGLPAREAPSGSRRQTIALAQVDRDVTAAGQLGDALDGCLQRVREGELRDRLADDADDGLRAAQCEGDEADAPAAPERERRPCGERGEQLEVVLRASVLEVELERRHRWLAEGQRGDSAPVDALRPRDAARPLVEGG
jgi:hypothetical protein